MIFDEKFVFYDQQSAKNLQLVLKKFGAKSRINEDIYNEQEEIVTGKLDDINRWLLSVADDNNSDIKNIIFAIHEKNVIIKDTIDQYLKDKSKGDFLYTHDELAEDVMEVSENMEEQMHGKDRDNPQDLIDLISTFIESSPLSIINRVLEDQGILEETEEGFWLKEKISGGDIIYQVPAMEAEYCTGPAFSGLKCITIFKPVIKYEVTINIMDIIDLDMDDIGIIMMGCGMEPDYTADLALDYLFKKTIIELILTGVDENRGISAEQLSADIMDEWSSVSYMGDLESRLDLDPEIIPAFVAELKRAGLLSGNLNHLKPVSAKSSKKRR
ncbi:hypothetical protein [Methanoplanus limicola]|uniref:Uncharacterized protein n=1 Tax=Methanoplanus limicola DSM 2279 TaxID=937775 RepID=H1Z1C2_9EURY|nr:hypothetical protein [Methanoplanus limicola]EHQ36269.1 hypothetical protein Metlim_2206 [Methanoplanus limicola DSM 2279]